MRSLIAQVLLLFFTSGQIIKRSPLQIGLISFVEKPTHLLGNMTHKSVISPAITGSYHHKWIRGHVHHHSYIPAHLHHFYIPTHPVILPTDFETVYVHPSIYNPYRSHIGGFGIGLEAGGHGIGHGFHVTFNI